jgi:peptidoglycan/xylan/chitin deacetylase (PgdA/CDA1 family)
MLVCLSASLLISCAGPEGNTGKSEITEWQDGKNGAVSLTFDDGSINQFRKALPLMNDLGFPATFFINTGYIAGSQYRGTFIGRDVQAIIEETATLPTDEGNFYERSSAAGYLGYEGTLEYHSRAGAQIDADHPEEAYAIMDELYEKVRNGEFPPLEGNRGEGELTEGISWDDLRTFAQQGHEFASHMVTHPRLAALDEANIHYELEKSREEILHQLGARHTFSAEVPFGTENERAMNYAHRVYPALRNRMPAPYLEELNRWNRRSPGSSDQEYVQWQRGALTGTHLPLMKSWVDTTAIHDNIWLVLVFHGVDGVGWEALSSDTLDAYFSYIKTREDDLWVATFGDVARYMRERMNATLTSRRKGRKIEVILTHSLDPSLYDVPLTVKTYVPPDWQRIRVKQAGSTSLLPAGDSLGSYVVYRAVPDGGRIEIMEN